jgi:hypothetical protein
MNCRATSVCQCIEQGYDYVPDMFIVTDNNENAIWRSSNKSDTNK